MKITDYFLEECAAQRGQMFLWAPVFLACGIGFYFYLPTEPPFWIALPFMGISALWLVAFKGRPALAVPAVIVLLAALGFFAAQVRTAVIDQPMIHKKTGPVEVTATIERVETMEAGKGQRLILIRPEIENLLPGETPYRIRLTSRKNGDYRQGTRVKLLASITPLSPPVAPGAFDFQRRIYFDGIGGLGFIYKNLGATDASASGSFMDNLRAAIAARFRNYVSANEAPMAIAFTTGERTAISDAQNKDMQNSGLAHLISISGLHIGVFSAFVFFMTRLIFALIPGFALRHPIKKYAAVLAFAAATFYTVLAGGSVPTVRSLIMVGVAYLAIMLDRSPLSLRLVAFAAFVILLIAPDSLVSVSFQMSFAAVAGLIIFYEWLRPFWIARNRNSGFLKKTALYVAGICVTSIIATLATAPLSLFQFQRLALYGVLSNAIAMPITTFIIMPAIALALLLMPLGLEWIPLKALDAGMAAVLRTAQDISNLPNAVWLVHAWPLSALVLICAGMVFAGLWQGSLRFLGALPIVLGLMIIGASRMPDIIITPEFDLAGYYSADGMLHIPGRRKNKFAIANLERLSGLEEGAAKTWPKEGRDGDITCDSAACRLELKGKKISFLKKKAAQREECAWGNLVISFDVLEQKFCRALDRRDGWKTGAQAIWLAPSGIRIETGQEYRGRRPWTK